MVAKLRKSTIFLFFLVFIFMIIAVATSLNLDGCFTLCSKKCQNSMKPSCIRDCKYAKLRGANRGGLTLSWKISQKTCSNIARSSSLTELHHNAHNIRIYGCFVYYWRCKGLECNYPYRGTNIPVKNILSSKDPNNLIALGVTGVSRPLFMFYKQTCPWSTRHRLGRRRYEYRHDPNAHKWVKYGYAVIDPNSTSQEYMELCAAVCLNYKFYALSLQGTLVVIEEVNSSMIITRVSSSRAVPSVLTRHFREYLVDSDGEILLIFLLSMKSTRVVDKVEIYRLQMENITWKKMDKLGKDRAVFAGADSCLVVTASEAGCKGNCIYITNRGVDGWWVYDVARGDISPCSSSGASSTLFDSGVTP